ncbi:hypothetical protein ROHU_004793 [Labeo rohita]|uniref:Uncharacterized protein n=1 Tax=Labeo rohita TaxID=84645 RepID=A0A498NHK1_LABRO|nr:hypothetical protein ROHU_004793 [Labeo rohita]
MVSDHRPSCCRAEDCAPFFPPPTDSYSQKLSVEKMFMLDVNKGNSTKKSITTGQQNRSPRYGLETMSEFRIQGAGSLR